jgi:hypothetical protein
MANCRFSPFTRTGPLLFCLIIGCPKAAICGILYKSGMVKRAGDIVSPDELIVAAWPGMVI